MRIKFVKFFDEAPDFNAGLVIAVKIVEENQFKAPWVEISPRWIYDEDSPEGRMVFDIEVSTTINEESGEEITENPQRFMR